MIKEIRIINFQAHEKLRLILDPHITVITGASDSGKSAIIRAFSFAIRNRPSGTEFIRHGAKQAKVSVLFDDHKVTRTRGTNSRDNSYHLDGQELSAFGLGVPEEIRELFCLEDINFQGQHEKMYWFGESDGEVSRQLNSIVNLGIIDETLARAGTALRTRRAELDVTEKRRAEALTNRNNLKHFEVMDADLKLVEAAYDSVTDCETNVSALEVVMEEMRKHGRLVKAGKSFCESAGVVEVAGEALQAADEAATQLEQDLADLADLDAQRGIEIPDIRPLVVVVLQYQSAHKAYESLQDDLDSLYALKAEADEARKIFDEEDKVFRSIKTTVCPTCGQKYSHDHGH